MSVEQALCREVALLLSQSERQNKDSPNKTHGNPNPTKAGPSASLVEQASMFASTWNFISSSIDASRPPSQEIGECYQDNSDLATYLSSVGNSSSNNPINPNIKASTEDSADVPRKVSSEERLIEDLNKNNYFPCELMGQGPFMSDSAYDLCPTGIHSAGAPSTVQSQSFYGLLSGLTDITLKLSGPEPEPEPESGGERTWPSAPVSVSKTASSRSLKNVSQTISNNENNENPSCNYGNRSRVFIKSKEMEGNPSASGAVGGGINGILDLDLECSSGTVGSTHRSSPVPRCAVDYVQRIRTSHPSESDIPSEMYKYLVGSDLNSDPSSRALNTHEVLQHDNGIPILLEEGPSPITNRSFLNSVNDEIKKIQYDQAKERSIYSATMGDFITTINSNTQYGHLFNGSLGNTRNGNSREGGSSSHLNNSRRRTGTAIINSNTRDQVKAESGVQTEAESAQGEDQHNLENSLLHHSNNSVGIGIGTRNGSTSSSSMWMGEPQSEMPSHISSMASVRERNLGVRRLRPQQQQQLYPINPGATSSESLEIREQQLQLQRQRAVANRGNIFGNFMNVNTALGLTKYSLQAAWNTAEEIFRGYIVPPEISEDRGPVPQTGEERVANETNMSVSIMRLLGLPLESRQTIYREVLGDMNAIQEFSVETIQMISSVIDWICTGNHSGADDLIAKTRVLATSQTEVDLDSDDWRNFERDIGLFTNAVTSAVGSAANLLSRQCTESADSLRRMTTSTTSTLPPLQDRSSVNVALHRSTNILESVTSIISNTMTGMSDIGSRTTSRTTTRESEYGSNVNPALIAQMITDSEFELLPTESASLSRTDSLATTTASITSTISGRGGEKIFSKSKSRIPIPIASSTVPVSPTSNSDLRDSIPPKAFSNRESYTRFERERQNECSNKNKHHQNKNQQLNGKNSSRDLLSNKSSVKFSSSTLLERTSQETLARRGPSSKMQQVSNKAGRKDETISTGARTGTGTEAKSLSQCPPNNQANHQDEGSHGTVRREKFLSPEDAELLKECRRLTKANVSAPDPGSSRNSSVVLNDSDSQRFPGSGSASGRRNEETLSGQMSNGIEIEPAEVANLATAIATVASCVTTALLGRAASAASYIPSLSDTFGLEVGPDEYRFAESIMDLDNHEDSILDSINKAAATASSILFGLDGSVSADNNSATTRPSNRKIRSRDANPSSLKTSASEVSPNVSPFHINSSPEIYQSNQNPVRQHQQQFYDPHLDSADLTRQASLNNNSIPGQSHGQRGNAGQHNNNNNNTILSLSSSPSEQDIDPAWQLFDYIKYQEAEANFANQCETHSKNSTSPAAGSSSIEFESGISEESPPEEIQVKPTSKPKTKTTKPKPNASITARLSKASLNALFDTFQEYHPTTNGKGTSYSKCGNADQMGNKNVSLSNANLRTASQIFKALSKSNGNSKDSLITNSNTNFSPDLLGSPSPSVPALTVPQNSNVEMTREMAEMQMHEDIAYLENIVNALYESNLIENPNPQQDEPESEPAEPEPEPEPVPVPVPESESASLLNVTASDSEAQVQSPPQFQSLSLSPSSEANKSEKSKVPPVPAKKLHNPTKKLPLKIRNRNSSNSSLRKEIEKPRGNQGYARVQSPSPRNSPSSSLRQSVQSSGTTLPNQHQSITGAKSIPNKTYGKNIGLRSPATASYSRPRIVHQSTPPPQSTGTTQPTRSTPVKPKARIQIISAVPGYLSSTQPSPTATSTNLSGSRPHIPGTGTGTGPWPGNESSRSLSHQNQENLVPVTGPQTQRPSSSGGGYPYAQKKSSYLKISKQKSTVQSQGQPVGQQRAGKFNSYSSRYSAQAQAHEGSVSTLHKLRQGPRPRNNGPVSGFGLRPLSTSTSQSQGQESPKTTTTYKYGDGSHSNNSGKNIDGSETETACSSTMSSVPASTNPSRHLQQLALTTIIGNQGISSSDLNTKSNSSTKNPTDGNPNPNNSSSINPPLFFPPLGNPLITFQPLSDIMNPFSSKIPGNKN